MIESYIPTNALLYTIIYYSKMSVLKHLKTLQHVSIFSDRLQGARRFLVKVTEFKIFTTVKVICDDAAASPQITPQWCRWIFQ